GRSPRSRPPPASRRRVTTTRSSAASSGGLSASATIALIAVAGSHRHLRLATAVGFQRPPLLVHLAETSTRRPLGIERRAFGAHGIALARASCCPLCRHDSSRPPRVK